MPTEPAVPDRRRLDVSVEVIADSVPALVAYVDRETRYRFTNRVFREWFGLRPGEARGRKMQEVLGDDVWREVQPQVARVLGGTEVRFDVLYRRHDGARRPMEAVWVPHEVEGTVEGFFTLVSDVSHRKAAEQSLRQQLDLVRRLNGVGRLLTGELDIVRIVQGVTDAATELTGAAWGSFHGAAGAPAGHLSFRTDPGTDASSTGEPLPYEAEPFGPALRGEGSVRIGDLRTDAGFRPGAGPASSTVSCLAVPVISRSGEVLGVFYFGHREPDRFGEREQGLAEGLAAQAAVAIDAARAFEREQRARAAAEAAETRFRFLADAGEVLASSRHVDATLGALASLTVPRLADLAGVDVCEAGRIERMAVAAADPELEDLLWDLADSRAATEDDEEGVGRVVRTGQPVLYPVIGDDLLDRTAADAERRLAVRRLQLGSVMIVPLNAGGRTLGALWFGRRGDKAPFARDDLQLAARLGEMAAVALDNARTWERLRRAAGTAS